MEGSKNNFETLYKGFLDILEKLNSKKVSELKDLLKAHGLNVGGVKQELVDRFEIFDLFRCS